MDLTPFVEHLKQEVAVAAEAGGEEARALVERLTAPVESAIRLTLLEALSAAADEITRELAPGAVDVRLRARDAEFVVTLPPAEPADEPEVAPLPESDGEVPFARINFRMPEPLKARIEEAAAREHVSVNAWLGQAAAAALQRHERPSRRGTGGVGESYTGWAR